MPRNRAPALVGRDSELRIVERALKATQAGRGGTMFVTGDGGIGKSRLAAAAADMAFTAEMGLLRGRGSAVGPIVPFRSLTEALLSLLRSDASIDVAQLGPYRHVLGRLIPDWADGDADPDGTSLVILAEAVLRLAALAGHGRGCLIVLDDLQDADAETLAVVEYLIDNIDRQATVLLCTIRTGRSAALDLARSAAQRSMAVLMTLGPLGAADVRRLASSCLGCEPAEVPEPVVDHLVADSAGNPLLAEELLAAVVDGGQLVRGVDGWRMSGAIQTNVPDTLAHTVAQRVMLLDPNAQELLSVAAVLGRRFPLAVVQAVTGLDDRSLLSHLHGDIAGQLVAPDEQTPDWYAFQHPLIGDAVLSLLTPRYRADLARRAADAVEAAYPDLPAEWCQMAATLRLRANEPTSAGRHFLEAGRRALAQGAATSAVNLLDRANDLLAADPHQQVRANALEALVYALAEAGLMERALALAGTLDEIGAGLDPRRRAGLHTRLAWAANVAGRTETGLGQVELARQLLGPGAAEQDLAPIDVVEAHLLLDRPAPEQLHVAEAMARKAAAVAEAVPLPVVACQAWQLLGALTRRRDLDEATACLERARTIAVRHQLPIWEIHALVRLGNDEALRDGSLDRLEQTQRAALQCGAVTASYHAETNIALHSVLRGDFAATGGLIDRALGATTRLKLMETTQYLLLARATLAAHQGRRQELNDALSEFRRWEGDEQRHAPRVYGLARAFCALLEEDRERAFVELARERDNEDGNPTVFQLGGQHGAGLLLHVLAGLDEDVLNQFHTAPARSLRWNRQFVLFARAVLAGRAGRSDEATATFEEALRAAAPYAMARHLGMRLVGEAALNDGWGSPVPWLRAAEEYFHAARVVAVASACRALLRRAGVTVSQRRTGADDIPPALRAVGVTVREYEVLLLVMDRLSNREIASRLYLSHRTIEKHVASLIAKTGRSDRLALSEFASGIAS